MKHLVYPIIGMSPGNSYFKDEVVRDLLKKVINKYGSSAILIPDIPAIATYIAMGYPENIARRDKAIPKSNNLRNRTQKAMDELGYSKEQVLVIDWEKDIERHLSYKAAYQKIRELYEINLAFKEAANEATKKVLGNAGKKLSDIECSARIGAHYLLAEIAFMEFSPDYLQADKIVYIYHRHWPIYEDYVAGKFDKKPKDYLGFEIIKIATQ